MELQVLLIDHGICEGRGGEAYTTVGDVENVVEPLQERHAINEVQPLTAQATDIVNDEEDLVWVSADCRIQLWRK